MSVAGNRRTVDESVEVAGHEVAMQEYFAAELDRRRTEPTDDLLTALLQARLGADDDVEGEPLCTEEILSMLSLLLVAGIETTTNLLGFTMRFLGEQPDYWEWLREDPSAHSEQFVEEALRLFSPVKAIARRTKTDTSLQGVEIAAGSVVFLAYAAANRDDSRYTDPDAFDPTRPDPRRHLAFGHGTHYCLGAPLARLETQVTLRRATERFHAPVLGAGNGFAQRPGWLLPGLKGAVRGAHATLKRRFQAP